MLLVLLNWSALLSSVSLETLRAWWTSSSPWRLSLDTVQVCRIRTIIIQPLQWRCQIRSGMSKHLSLVNTAQLSTSCCCYVFHTDSTWAFFPPKPTHVEDQQVRERKKKMKKKRETAVNKKTCHWSLVQSRQPAEFHVSVTAVSLIWCAWYFGVESSGIHRRDHRHSASVTNRVLKSKNILKRSDRIWFFHSEEVCSEELWLRFCLIFCTWWENSTRDKSSGSQLQTQQHCHLDHLRKQNKRATWWQWMSGYWFCLTVQRSQVWSPVMRSSCIDVRFYFKACK